jgi:hypothetical protein
VKRTKRRDVIKHLKRLKISCLACGQAQAVRYDRIGRPVCGKTHRRKRVPRVGI